MLITNGITKRYGAQLALDDVSVHVSAGDIYGLVGRNGAGKTTLFRIIMGLIHASSGSLELMGAASGTHGSSDGPKTDSSKVIGLNAARHNVGCMISPSFYPYLNATDNLMYIAQLKGICNARSEVAAALKKAGLAHAAQPFKAFSMGMKQRLGITAALLGHPPLVILDEPINGLDPQGISDIRTLIRHNASEYGTTFIISSHILSELDMVATCFGFVERGRLLQEIAHDDLHFHARSACVLRVDNARAALQVLVKKFCVTAHVDKNDIYKILIDDTNCETDKIVGELVGQGIKIYEIYKQETTLEDYFMQLVAKAGAVNEDASEVRERV
jgi:ABC-2 type transport system ATP-binding protein